MDEMPEKKEVEAPADDKPPVVDGKPDPEKLLADAKASGALKPLDDLMAQEGWELSGEEALLLAQKDERTRGKSPEELASILSGDHSIYNDLVALKPGGALAREGIGKPKDAADDEGPPEKKEGGNPFDEKEEPADEPAPKKGRPFFGGAKASPFGG